MQFKLFIITMFFSSMNVLLTHPGRSVIVAHKQKGQGCHRTVNKSYLCCVYRLLSILQSKYVCWQISYIF